MSIDDGRSRQMSAVLLGALLLTAAAGPVAHAGRPAPPCVVRNVTQGTESDSFKAMVNAVEDGDELEVSGVCKSVEVDIRGVTLTITGVGDPRPVLDAQGRALVLMTGVGPDRTDITLRHLELTNGVGPGYGGQFGSVGGAIQNLDRLTLVDCLVRGNRTRVGAALENLGNLTITDSIIRGNVGGAIANSFYTRVTITGSVIRGNTTDTEGGAIWNDEDGIISIADSVIRGNTSGLAGGGIYNGAGGKVTIVDSVIRGNTADTAAASKRGPRGGGGIWNKGRLVLEGAVITANTADAQGGGIWNGGKKGTVTLDAATSVRSNTPDDCFGTTAC